MLSLRSTMTDSTVSSRSIGKHISIPSQMYWVISPRTHHDQMPNRVFILLMLSARLSCCSLWLLLLLLILSWLLGLPVFLRWLLLDRSLHIRVVLIIKSKHLWWLVIVIYSFPWLISMLFTFFINLIRVLISFFVPTFLREVLLQESWSFHMLTVVICASKLISSCLLHWKCSSLGSLRPVGWVS